LEIERDRRSRFYQLDKPTNICGVCSNYNFRHTSLAGAIKGQYTTAMSSAGLAKGKSGNGRDGPSRVEKRSCISVGAYCFRARDEFSRDDEENNKRRNLLERARREAREAGGIVFLRTEKLRRSA
jgi:hypothetical protein